MYKLISTFVLNLFVILPLTAKDSIHLQTFKGESINPYVKDITDLCITVFREYPYCYEGTEEEYRPFIEHYAHSDNGIACLLFENDYPIGVAIGMPLNEMREQYMDPFITARPQENCDELFYLGEFVLLKEYRGRGLGKEMYLELEDLVRENRNVKKMCFCKIDETNSEPTIPENYRSLDGFWEKLGFDQCDDVAMEAYWHDIGQIEASSHKLVYWLKSF